jgi:hypothetical protein
MTDEKALRLFRDMVKLYNTEKAGQLWSVFNMLQLQEQKEFINIFKGLLTFHSITEKQRQLLAESAGVEFIPQKRPLWMEG